MKRCLFVDDSSVIRKVAKRILNGPDLVVVEASTGAEGLDMCAYDMPEIIVVDGALEDMTPAEFIRRVRAMDGRIKPQIAICLTEVDIGAIMRAKRAGAQGYLLKPFTRPHLIDRFRAFDVAA
ncbi:response regulator [Aminobacter sp. AP02]|uniref:response regulator n=1 Tax=Aminobacter sp. AP02 TaxID=2135737 RepID=UPI000D6C164D|nr:response regulator [Aminobacter sp. AP02]PWK71529.1 response regulator receiver protein [Aminobacter sp. AP02]